MNSIEHTATHAEVNRKIEVALFQLDDAKGWLEILRDNDVMSTAYNDDIDTTRRFINAAMRQIQNVRRYLPTLVADSFEMGVTAGKVSADVFGGLPRVH